ncbi:hypothetical protein VKT23_011598 [Stygiomarasmius scandens]|uniref:T6SS Phospholipase effector Tle1-like catalytic domain-containing protein n=1 Tax=Marasmiellus scandens TaxID=2682957 RepID=A0ABR1J9K7_9AGAR
MAKAEEPQQSGILHDTETETQEIKPASILHSDTNSKEVWFAGTHSDIGGGYRKNIALNNASVPLLWMENEANRAGLQLKMRDSDRGEWNWGRLVNETPTESLTPGLWYLFEDLPITSWHAHR